MPAAKVSFADFNADLKRGVAPAYLLTGPRFFQERALKALRARLIPAGGEDGALAGLGDGAFDPVEFCDLAREIPMFTPHRLVFALGLKDKDLKALAGLEETAAALFDRPNPRATLVLGCAETRALTAKFFSRAGLTRYDFAPLYPEKIGVFASDYARELGFALPAAAARAIAAASGGEAALAAAEVDKLALIAAGGRLDEAAALALIAGPQTADFELSNLIEAGNLDGALQTLAQEMAAETDAVELLNAVAGAIGTLRLTKSLPEGELAAALRKPPFIVSRIAAAARPLSLARLARAQRALARLELLSRRQVPIEAGLVAALQLALGRG